MKKKIIGIFVCMLLIATTFPVIGMEINKEMMNTTINDSNEKRYTELEPPKLPLAWWLGVDQKQEGDCGLGLQIRPPYWFAQEFKPSKEKLIGVELWFFKYQNPPTGLEITVSIRDSLNGSDLTTATVDADPIKSRGTWVLIDFDDITVTPGDTYYIVCRGGGGDDTNVYCWTINANNSYEQGIAWQSGNDGAYWDDLEDWDLDYPEIDFCFRTYHSKSKNKAFIFNFPFLSWLFERFPNAFPILRYLIGL